MELLPRRCGGANGNVKFSLDKFKIKLTEHIAWRSRNHNGFAGRVALGDQNVGAEVKKQSSINGLLPASGPLPFIPFAS